MRLLLTVLLCLGAAFVPVVAEPPPNYTGSYALASAKTDRQFSLDIEQSGKKARISFSAAMADGSGAAPDAEGKGRIEDGVSLLHLQGQLRE